MRRTTSLTKEDVAVKRSSTGLGLYAVRTLIPGQFLEYTGRLIPNEKADERPDGRYFFDINSRWTLDGSDRSNLARYINHACKPNCEAMQIGKRIFIKVVKKVRPGDELTYDYGDEYVDDVIKPYGCKCFHCGTSKKN
jgi:SET domain-containing protein